MGSNTNSSQKDENLKSITKDGFINFGYESEKNESKNDNSIVKESATKKDVDFDDIIPYFGNFGKYQIILFLLLAPYTLFFVFVYFTQIFITLVPEKYWCHVPELQHLGLEER